MEVGDFDKLKSTEVWCSFGADGEVLLKYISIKDLTSIEKKATSRTFKRGQMHENVDHTLLAKLLGRAAVKGWKNLTAGGETFPFNEKNLDKLMEMSFDFRAFVNDKASEISTFMGEEAEEAVGKPGGTPSTGS